LEYIHIKNYDKNIPEDIILKLIKKIKHMDDVKFQKILEFYYDKSESLKLV